MAPVTGVLPLLTRSKLTPSPRPDVEPKTRPRPIVRSSFFGEASLPSRPEARQHEKRGRRWLVVSFLLCPCHVPLALALAAAVLGGSTLGAAITGNGLRVGIVMTALYALMLWRGFRLIRQAKRLEAQGGRLDCTANGCEVVKTER